MMNVISTEKKVQVNGRLLQMIIAPSPVAVVCLFAFCLGSCMSTSKDECSLSFLRLKIHACLVEIMSTLSIFFFR